MPKHFITYLFGKLASLKAGFITTGVIKAFVHHYKVDMQEAKESNPANFATFNDFFVRELKENVRPIDNNAQMLCLPADACVSQAGKIENGRLIQAKGHTFDACELLGGDQNLAAEFTDGHFATLYLSPRDYHRVHMPCDGKLRQMIYIPGDLFSVNPLTAESVFNLFARNERVVCIFDTDFGPMAQVLVGATIVGSVETPWHGTVMPPREKSIRRWEYPEEGEQSITLKKGEEMGRFKLGSTVINLFAKDAIAFVENIIPGQATKMGAAYAEKVTVSTECNPVSDEADSK